MPSSTGPRGALESYLHQLAVLEDDPLPSWSALVQAQVLHARLVCGVLSDRENNIDGPAGSSTPDLLPALADGYERIEALRSRYLGWETPDERLRRFAVALLDDASGAVPAWALETLPDRLADRIGPAFQSWCFHGRNGASGASCRRAAGDAAEAAALACPSGESVTPAVLRFVAYACADLWEARTAELLGRSRAQADRVIVMFYWLELLDRPLVPLLGDAVGMSSVRWLAATPRVAILRAPVIVARWLARRYAAGERCAPVGDWPGDTRAYELLRTLADPVKSREYELALRDGADGVDQLL